MGLELIVMTSLVLLWMAQTTSARLNVSLAKEGCQPRCGNISIPYPFGIGANCYIDYTFSVECRGDKLYLTGINLQVLNVSVEGWVQVNNPILSQSCPGVDGSADVVNGSTSVNLTGSPFVFSDRSNVFISVGCNNHARVTNLRDGTTAQCITICGGSPDRDNSCFGINCCQTTPPGGFSYDLRVFKVNLSRIETYNQSGGVPEPLIPCMYAFLVDRNWFRNNLTDPFALRGMSHVPAMLEWKFCNCGQGYEGNPYLPNGCVDVCLYNQTDPNCYPRKNNNSKSKMILIGKLHFLQAFKWRNDSHGSEESRSLATYFIQSMEENRILKILDPRILKDGRREEMIAVAHLGKRCLNLNGKKRPTMREVAIELEGIKMSQGVSTTEQNYQEEFEYSTTDLSEVWGIASTSTTVSFLDSHKALSVDVEVDVQPLLVNKP
ncbi:hypothetical protein Acr_05g0002350 [Actinidia rufa]|uniref:Wall-associated receptor kinase galacturonan-binding domain-containing protein n=1 Tax=Actinidia rufa TaxID=165716 RepID=A0A7J0EK68_9ERIC|nr:hypothetical protein Acr_05g0002350 [Actinidia rufa]